jgi:hypothetical protein
MIEKWLNRHVWRNVPLESEWWTKGFICGVLMTILIYEILWRR